MKTGRDLYKGKLAFIVSVLFLTMSLFLACGQEKKADYMSQINEKNKIVAEADAQLAANKFDEAEAGYKKALSEYDALRQKIPVGDPYLKTLETITGEIKGKIEKIPAAKKDYESKITPETKKQEPAPEEKPVMKSKAKPKQKPDTKREIIPETKPKAKTETRPLQAMITISEGYACMGEDRTRKQTETAAMVDAKRRAVENVISYVSAIEKDSAAAYENGAVDVIQQIQGDWYNAASLGDCYRIKIRANVIPNVKKQE